MDPAVFSVPGPTWLGLVGIILIAVIYLVSRVRKNDMELLRGANRDLRDSMADRDKKIASLEQAVNVLEHKVEDLERKNKNFEDLIITALKQYFFENPKVATKIQDLITPPNK